MSFRDYLHGNEQYTPPRQVEPEDIPEEPREDRTYREEEEPTEEDSMEQEVDFYKKELYKKIDRCFVRYGLEGLKIINQGIAEALKQYIDGLKGGSRVPPPRPYREEDYDRRPRYRVDPIRRRPDPEPEEDDDPEEQIEEDAPVRIPRKPANIRNKSISAKPAKKDEQDLKIWPSPEDPANKVQEAKDPFDVDLINKMLEEVPPTEIHEVQVNSSIPRPWDKDPRGGNEPVDDIPVEEPETPVEEPESTFPVETPMETEEPPKTGGYDIANDMLAGVSDVGVSLIVPPSVEELGGDDGSDLDDPIEESPVNTPIPGKED